MSNIVTVYRNNKTSAIKFAGQYYPSNFVPTPNADSVKILKKWALAGKIKPLKDPKHLKGHCIAWHSIK